jgi:signal peptidase I
MSDSGEQQNDAAGTSEKPQKSSGWGGWLREWVVSFAVVVAVMLPMRSSLADWCDVPSGSMEPTILVGDRIWVNKLAYGLRFPFTSYWITRWATPTPGEIIVLHSPKDGTRLVKRCIAGPGDVVELKDNRLTINGKPLDYGPAVPGLSELIEPVRRESFKHATETLNGVTHPVMFMPTAQAPRSGGPLTVPAGQYFVMGDSRDRSADSRVFGFVDQGQIVGRSTIVALSLDRESWYVPRWSRFFKSIH